MNRNYLAGRTRRVVINSSLSSRQIGTIVVVPFERPYIVRWQPLKWNNALSSHTHITSPISSRFVAWKGSRADDINGYLCHRLIAASLTDHAAGNNSPRVRGRAVRYVSSVTLEHSLIEYYVSHVGGSAPYSTPQWSQLRSITDDVAEPRPRPLVGASNPRSGFSRARRVVRDGSEPIGGCSLVKAAKIDPARTAFPGRS